MGEGCTKTERPASVSSLFPEPQECNNAGYYFPFVRQPVTYSIEKMLFLPSFSPAFRETFAPAKGEGVKGLGSKSYFTSVDARLITARHVSISQKYLSTRPRSPIISCWKESAKPRMLRSSVLERGNE